jgi:putative transposase
LAIKPHEHHSAEEKAVILDTIRQAQARTGEPVEMILAQVGLPPATYYRWQARKQEERLADVVVVPHRQVPLPTPEEVGAVRDFALACPQMGYKRLTWQMVDENVAYLRPWQVYGILGEHNLLRRTAQPASQPLKRPSEPDRPDQVWHVDLMYLYIESRWYYLVDILDGYSRFLVHWSLNLTMLADTVTLTVQEALEGLSHRRPGEPKIVHDNGSQFLSAEWRRFVEGAGVTDIRTRVAHPQSNGRLERLHRTHREEGLTEEDLADYYRALEGMERWDHYYNYKRPHSALKYLRPVDYYRGKPAVRLAEREQKLVRALETRRQYWQTYGNVKEHLSLK